MREAIALGHDVADVGCWRQEVFRSEDVGFGGSERKVWALITSWRSKPMEARSTSIVQYSSTVLYRYLPTVPRRALFF